MSTVAEDATGLTYDMYLGSATSTRYVVPISGIGVPYKRNVRGDLLVSGNVQSGKHVIFVPDPHGQGPAIPIHSEDFTEVVDTAEVFADADLTDQIRKGIEQADRGETRSWADIKKEMGL